MPFSRRICRILMGLALVSTSCTKGTAIGPSESSDKEESTDDEKADSSAPVSGAYLTCYVPPPKDTDEYIVGGCQARDKNKNRLDLSKNNNVKWGFLPPAGNNAQVALAVYDMSHAKSQRYFDAVYQLKIPPKSASGLTQGASRRDLGLYFLNSVPVLSTRLTLLSESRKQKQVGTPVNALSLTANQNTFRQISARFPDPQSAPQTPAAMLSTNASGQPVNDQTFTPIVVQPLNFSSPNEVTYDTPEDNQGTDQGQYTTISGDPYYESGGSSETTGGTTGGTTGEYYTEGEDPFQSFESGSTTGSGGGGDDFSGSGETTGGSSGGSTGGSSTGEEGEL